MLKRSFKTQFRMPQLNSASSIYQTSTDSLRVYTDGSYHAQQNLGGWGVVIIDAHQKVWQYSGCKRHTSSLEMELTAAVFALQQLVDDSVSAKNISLYTDSKILLEGLEYKIEHYRRQNWIHKSGRPVESRELWLRLQHLSQSLPVSINWVKGHARNPGNLMADALARKALLTSCHTRQSDNN